MMPFKPKVAFAAVTGRVQGLMLEAVQRCSCGADTLVSMCLPCPSDAHSMS